VARERLLMLVSNGILFSLSLALDELVQQKEKYKSVADEMDQTFSELAGY